MKVGSALALPPPQGDPQEKQLRIAANMYEEQFLREMVKAMRKSVGESDLVKKNMAENIFREQLDQQYIKSWADQGGIGMGEMIYEHLRERYYPQASPYDSQTTSTKKWVK